MLCFDKLTCKHNSKKQNFPFCGSTCICIRLSQVLNYNLDTKLTTSSTSD